MRALWGILLLVLVSFQVSPLRILNIGDSLDRHSIFDFCDAHGGTLIDWTDQKLTYFSQSPAGNLCTLPNSNDSLAHLQVFGGNATGPYWKENDMRTATNIIDTKERLRYGIDLYLQKFPPPHIIFFHTVMWDLHYYLLAGGSVWYTVNTIGHEEYNRSIAQAQSNYMDRLHEISNSLESHGLQNFTRIGLRSAPYFPSRPTDDHCEQDGKYLIGGHNDLLRKFSRDNNITFYDYDADMWESVDHDVTRCDILRDKMHPTIPISLARANKIMGLQHCNLFHVRGSQYKPLGLTNWWLHPTTKEVLKRVYLIKYAPRHEQHHKMISSPHGNGPEYRHSNSNHMHSSLYFITYGENGQHPVKHANASHSFQRLYRLSAISDAYVITSQREFDEIPEGYPVPNAFHNPAIAQQGVIARIVPGMVSTAGKLVHEYYLIAHWEKRHVTRSDGLLFEKDFDVNNAHATLKGLAMVEVERNFLEYLPLGSPLVV
jgi:hypothetical protein